MTTVYNQKVRLPSSVSDGFEFGYTQIAGSTVTTNLPNFVTGNNPLINTAANQNIACIGQSLLRGCALDPSVSGNGPDTITFINDTTNISTQDFNVMVFSSVAIAKPETVWSHNVKPLLLLLTTGDFSVSTDAPARIAFWLKAFAEKFGATIMENATNFLYGLAAGALTTLGAAYVNYFIDFFKAMLIANAKELKNRNAASADLSLYNAIAALFSSTGRTPATNATESRAIIIKALLHCMYNGSFHEILGDIATACKTAGADKMIFETGRTLNDTINSVSNSYYVKNGTKDPKSKHEAYISLIIANLTTTLSNLTYKDVADTIAAIQHTELPLVPGVGNLTQYSYSQSLDRFAILSDSDKFNYVSAMALQRLQIRDWIRFFTNYFITDTATTRTAQTGMLNAIDTSDTALTTLVTAGALFTGRSTAETAYNTQKTTYDTAYAAWQAAAYDATTVDGYGGTKDTANTEKSTLNKKEADLETACFDFNRGKMYADRKIFDFLVDKFDFTALVPIDTSGAIMKKFCEIIAYLADVEATAPTATRFADLVTKLATYNFSTFSTARTTAVSGQTIARTTAATALTNSTKKTTFDSLIPLNTLTIHTLDSYVQSQLNIGLPRLTIYENILIKLTQNFKGAVDSDVKSFIKEIATRVLDLPAADSKAKSAADPREVLIRKLTSATEQYISATDLVNMSINYSSVSNKNHALASLWINAVNSKAANELFELFGSATNDSWTTLSTILLDFAGNDYPNSISDNKSLGYFIKLLLDAFYSGSDPTAASTAETGMKRAHDLLCLIARKYGPNFTKQLGKYLSDTSSYSGTNSIGSITFTARVQDLFIFGVVPHLVNELRKNQFATTDKTYSIANPKLTTVNASTAKSIISTYLDGATRNANTHTGSRSAKSAVGYAIATLLLADTQINGASALLTTAMRDLITASCGPTTATTGTVTATNALILASDQTTAAAAITNAATAKAYWLKYVDGIIEVNI